jgi:hypothetical protein
MLIDFFDIKFIEGGSNWGNVFLTDNWTLYIDKTSEQHDLAMARLGIDPLSVIISGYFHKPCNNWVVPFRSSRVDIIYDNNYQLLLRSIELAVHNQFECC